MRLLVIALIIIASLSYGKAFDMEGCVESCNGDQECIERCVPYEEPAPGLPEEENITNITANDSGNPEEIVETDEEESGICGSAIILAGIAGLVIKNAEREI